MLVSAVICATVCLVRLEGQDSCINFDSSSLTREGGWIKVAVSYPNDYTNRLDLFSCSDLIKGEWRLVLTAGADLSAHRTEWIDPESLVNPVRFYAAGNADITPATDPDGDGLPWAREVFFYRTSPTDADTDADGMPDGWEVSHGLNPVENDASLDADHDGLSNLQERQFGTDPSQADTDGDEMPDGWEAMNSLAPDNSADATQEDSARDGFTNLQKYQMGVDSGVFVTNRAFGEQEVKVTTPSWRGP